MLRKKLSLGGLASGVAVLLFTILMPLLAMVPASAAATCTWVDSTDMTCGNETFGNGTITGNTVNGDAFTLYGSTIQVGTKSCPQDTALVVNTTTAKTATVTTYTADSTGTKCVKQTASEAIGNTFNSVKCDGTAADSSGNCANASGSSCGGGSWDWAICPTDTLLQSLLGKLMDFYKDELTVQTNSIFTGSTGDAYYRAWNSFRIIGTALLVIGGLVMVASQAFGFELLDAYTIRRMLPRLLVAIIGMSLSWPLMNFVINFFNTVGLDLQNIMYAPFSTLPNHAALADGLISWGLAAAVVLLMAKGYGGVVLPVLGTGALALLIGILIIIVRQVGVILLVIVAPLAIASYVLPNTKKLWDLWRDNFLGLMLMFPIIMALIAAGQIFSQVGKSGDFLQQMVGIVAFFVPYFMIPVAFRMATGMISTIAGFVNDRSKGGFDRLKEKRQGAIHHGNEHIGRQVLAKRTAWSNKLQASRTDANGNVVHAGLGKRMLARGIGGHNIYAAQSAKQAAVAKEINDQIATGQDDEIRALTALEGADGRYYSLAGKEVSEAAVKRAKSRWGHDAFAQQAALSYEMRKASTEEESQRISDNYAEVATHNWHMSDGQATGTWIGAAFENQNQHLEYKNMRLEKNAAGGNTGRMTMNGEQQESFVDEIYENRGSYNMASMRSNTIEQLKNSYSSATTAAQDANDILSAGIGSTFVNAQGQTVVRDQSHMDAALQARNEAVDKRQKIQAVAETFMHEAGFGGGTVAQPGDDQQPITAGAAGRRQANTPGAAHVAERVRELAEMTGVGPSGSAPAGSYGTGHARTTPGAVGSNQRPQS